MSQNSVRFMTFIINLLFKQQFSFYILWFYFFVPFLLITRLKTRTLDITEKYLSNCQDWRPVPMLEIGAAVVPLTDSSKEERFHVSVSSLYLDMVMRFFALRMRWTKRVFWHCVGLDEEHQENTHMLNFLTNQKNTVWIIIWTLWHFWESQDRRACL